MQDEWPEAVRILTDTVSGKLGRPAHCRKVKNREEWFVYDPVFSFVQLGMRKGGTGYRGGYKYQAADNTLWFILVHSPVLAALFKRNLVFSSLLAVVKTTAKYRQIHYLQWDSKCAFEEKLPGSYLFCRKSDTKEFIDEIKHFDENVGFTSDLFPVLPNTGKGGGKAISAGNTFYLRLADAIEPTNLAKSLKELISLSWPLFLCLYPVAALEKRSASLAKKMIARKIPQVCEFTSIKFTDTSLSDELCRGQIQGAHIKPHIAGGSDLPENGLWLCEYHHRMTEGKLSGSRTGEMINVRFTGK